MKVRITKAPKVKKYQALTTPGQVGPPIPGDMGDVRNIMDSYRRVRTNEGLLSEGRRDIYNDLYPGDLAKQARQETANESLKRGMGYNS